MASRFLASAVAIMLLGVAFAAPVLLGKAYAANTWYVGQGAKQNMYVKYTVQEYDTNQDRPFEMVIYFASQTSDGKWIAPTYVIDQGKVIQANLTLGANLSVLRTGNDNIPSDMNIYLGAYARTLQWLSAFSPQSQPQSLTALSWGKIACIGCGTLDPGGSEKVTVQAGTYDTTVLVNHRGQHDSKLWVNTEMPYPVKALAYADVTQGQPPIQFAFELLDVGTGKPTPPASTSFVPQPPLSLTTQAGDYKITLDWSPAELQPGTPATFTVHFANVAGAPVSRVNYEFTVKDDKKNTIQDIKDQNSDTSGVGSQQVKFNNTGSYQVTVTINGVAGVPTGEFIEAATFGIVVVPEFPVSIALFLAAIVGVVAVVSRTGFAGSLFGRNMPA